MDNWEKLKNISLAVSLIVIPVIVGFIGHEYTKAITEREIQGKFVELGVRILEQEPSEHTRNIRGWAVKVLNTYSGVAIDEATMKELIENIPIPSSSTNLSQIQLSPGHQFSFGFLQFRLESCSHKANVTTCHLVITSSKGTRQFTLRPRSMSPKTAVFLLKGETQQWHYRHGPIRSQLIELQPDTENHFELQFTGIGESRTDQSILLQVDVHGLQIMVSIEPTI